MSEIALSLNEYIRWNPLETLGTVAGEVLLKLAKKTAPYLGDFGIVVYGAMTRAAEALGAEETPDTAGQAKRAARAGTVMDEYGNSILRTAYMYLHNMSDAEDILQDTLIQYIRKAPVFENDGHEKAWLLTVAANLSKNKINYNRLRETDELAEELVGEEQQDLAFVWEAVKQLPEKYREVVHLFYQEGYATAEIAKILGRNESTVRSDLKRGRDRLKEILKEAYDFE